MIYILLKTIEMCNKPLFILVVMWLLLAGWKFLRNMNANAEPIAKAYGAWKSECNEQWLFS